MITIIKNIIRFFKRTPTIKKPFVMYVKGKTVPQAFDYPDELFQKLVNELTFLIKPDDRITTFAGYIESPIFQAYKLNLNNPNHAAILGYAFCLSIVLQHQLMQKTVINDVLETFAASAEQSDKTTT